MASPLPSYRPDTPPPSETPVRFARTPIAGATPVIGLLSADDRFEQALPAADVAVVRQNVRLPRLDLPRGLWEPEQAPWAPPIIGALVVEGLIACNLSIGGRASTELLGPGDVFSPWRPAAVGGGQMTWVVHQESVLAALNKTFLAAGRRWPGLLALSHIRLAERIDRLALRAAALQLARVEDRLLAVMWQLADRFGRVGKDGVSLDLPLTHQILGQLVGAQRPTVTLAIQALSEEGQLLRKAEGGFLLPWSSRTHLEKAVGWTQWAS